MLTIALSALAGGAAVAGAMHVLKRAKPASMLGKVYRALGGGGPGAEE